MQRSDSVLLTGMTSNTISKVERNREKETHKREEKLKAKALIHPSIEPVLQELEKEKNRATLEIIELVEGTPSEQTIESLKLYRQSMDKLKSRLTNIMRTKPELKDEPKDD